MNDAIDSLANAVESTYHGFILRDLLGFVAPGALFLISTYSLTGAADASYACASAIPPRLGFQCIWRVLGTDMTPAQAIALLAASYLTALILQSIHHGLVDWVFRLTRRHRAPSWTCLLRAVPLYAHAAASPEDCTCARSPKLSLITEVAIAFDRAPSKTSPDAYSERLSALSLMAGNASLASIPLLVHLYSRCPFHGALGTGIVFFLYIEHWRILYARKRRIHILPRPSLQRHRSDMWHRHRPTPYS